MFCLFFSSCNILENFKKYWNLEDVQQGFRAGRTCIDTFLMVKQRKMLLNLINRHIYVLFALKKYLTTWNCGIPSSVLDFLWWITSRYVWTGCSCISVFFAHLLSYLLRRPSTLLTTGKSRPSNYIHIPRPICSLG